ncbi:MAG: hypothetical protein DLM61_21845 [Pseudonocardiales bacterium]|nr:MAG: hypothetical protein DLM61_21845 [Pseudonocardiales bacterium]
MLELNRALPTRAWRSVGTDAAASTLRSDSSPPAISGRCPVLAPRRSGLRAHPIQSTFDPSPLITRAGLHHDAERGTTSRSPHHTGHPGAEQTVHDEPTEKTLPLVTKVLRLDEPDPAQDLPPTSGTAHLTAVLTAASSTVPHSNTTGRTPHPHVARSDQGPACIC